MTAGPVAQSPAYAASPTQNPRHASSVVDGTSDPETRDATRAAGPGLYIVTLTAEPSAVYDGGVPGFPATRPENGKRFDRTGPAVVSYEERLADRQDRILAGIGDPVVLYRLRTAVNGFVAELSGGHVKELRATAGVSLVEKSTTQTIDSTESPGFLGLDGPGGVWDRNGGQDDAGKGTVVGVIDSGIWPENPSFAGLPLKSPGVSDAVAGFHGACQSGEQWSAGDCNEKVVSARYFVKGFGTKNVSKSEYLSPRDGSGHGSRTASIAAGNDAVSVEIEGQGFGEASGMAPAARIASYKACWSAPNPEDDGCSTADAVAAINQAVADGVGVINYSISGSKDTIADSVELAFLNAATAGVFIATSAGNSGPDPGSVAHPSPWVTTVAASTHQQRQAAVSLGDGTSYVGAMLSDHAVPSTGLVMAEDAAGATATPDDARLCRFGALDAAKTEDRIVVCDRGVTARVDKSAAVASAGGAGMILVNITPGSQDADFHAVPTVHLDGVDGRGIQSYVEEAGDDATASINPDASDDTTVPQIAEFSSRGPSLAAGGDLLKPDLSAPGVGVVSAVAPASNTDRLWDLYSGTSMSAPHVAGLAAFVKGVHADWSPAQIKSSMMTTAYDLDGNDAPFSQGAGQVDPSNFLDPGLVYDATVKDWHGFLRGQGFANEDGSAIPGKAIDSSDLNVPSIAVGELTGRTTVTRTVTNVSGRTESFSADVTGLNGVRATVLPSTLLLSPGESASFKVRLVAQDNAQLATYTEGALTWSGLTGYDVRIPVVVKPEPVAGPKETSASGSTGSLGLNIRSGSDNPIELSTAGLVGALPAPVTLLPGSFDPADPQQDEDTSKTTIDVPAGIEIARFQMDAHNSADDLDVFVFYNDELVAQSADDSADETVTLVDPEAGRYDIYISSFAAANGATTTGQFFTWVVGHGDAGNLTLEPSTIEPTTGQRFEHTASWDGLDMTQRWFGAIRYDGSDHRTFVTIK